MQKQLETLVDSHSLSAVLSELSVICQVKADHIRGTWQDESLARKWDEAGGMLESTSFSSPIEEVSYIDERGNPLPRRKAKVKAD